VTDLFVREPHPKDGGPSTSAFRDMSEALRVEVQITQYLKQSFGCDGAYAPRGTSIVKLSPITRAVEFDTPPGR
jgi:hypothetical protein